MNTTALDALSFYDIKPLVEEALLKGSEAPLDESEVLLLQGCWGNLSYDEIAGQTCNAKGKPEYSRGMLERTIAPQLFERLSKVYGTNIYKRTFRTHLESLLIEAHIDLSQPSLLSDKVIGSAPIDSRFVGRRAEIQLISQAISTQRCVLIQSLIPGIGKSAIASKVFCQHQALGNFDVFVWKHCTQNKPSDDLQDLCRLMNLSNISVGGLLNTLRERRILVCLDGINIWLQDYRRETDLLIQQFVETEHNSCILITSSKFFPVADRLSRVGRSVSIFDPKGLNIEDSKLLLKQYGIEGSNAASLAQACHFNPYYMHYISEKIEELFGGSVENFLLYKTSIANEALRDTFDSIFLAEDTPLKEVERFILAYLALETSNHSIKFIDVISSLKDKFYLSASDIINGIQTLKNASMIQTNDDPIKLLTVPSAVLSYVSRNSKNIFPIKDSKLQVGQM
jgi:hypothetical protein